MMRQLPFFSTIFVLIAAATMVGLGIWQIGRMDEKEALIARYTQSQTLSASVEFPRNAAENQQALYRRSSIDCVDVTAMDSKGAASKSGARGWAHIARCRLADGTRADVALGFSRDPNPQQWTGGPVSGFIGPAGRGVRLVASPPAQADLQPLALPDPNDMPNNHLAYAGQWFFFALTALGVYWLAVRKRLARPASEG
ncbi:SURF1 family protein [Altererythrobacter aquiaggeris]|uniref:SURF1 family protein n=1 Tax=Aestuarierythrobacter aquiaggeris TaxID=1898396 RepID=UPI003018C1ED